MKILYIGDIMGRAGRRVVAEKLPGVIAEHQPDVVVAQSENVSHGKGITPAHFDELRRLGIDFFTGGNHSLEKPNSHNIFNDKHAPIIRPANMKGELAGVGHKTYNTKSGSVLFVSILGDTFPEHFEIDNPLNTIDSILKQYESDKLQAVVVNFHGDFSSQKRMIGFYLDGRVSAVVGDHWHVPTADAAILPKGTAHISDVGMCGSLNSSLGMKLEETTSMWKTGEKIRKEMDDDKPWQFNAVLIDTSSKTQSKSIDPIHLTSE